jgi:hypothetical protein
VKIRIEKIIGYILIAGALFYGVVNVVGLISSGARPAAFVGTIMGIVFIIVFVYLILIQRESNNTEEKKTFAWRDKKH